MKFAANIFALVFVLPLLVMGSSRADVIINYTGSVDNFNSGPFTSGAAISGQIVLDDTVVATGVNNTFNNVITSFSFHVAEPGVSGGITYTGSGGRIQQFSSAGGTTDFLSVSLNGSNGSFAGPSHNGYTPLSFDIDFRGANLFTDPTVLATNLTEADFSRSFLSFNFSHPTLSNALMVERSLDTVSFTSDSVPEPGTALVLSVGVLAVVINRRRRICRKNF